MQIKMKYAVLALSLSTTSLSASDFSTSNYAVNCMVADGVISSDGILVIQEVILDLEKRGGSDYVIDFYEKAIEHYRENEELDYATRADLVVGAKSILSCYEAALRAQEKKM